MNTEAELRSFSFFADRLVLLHSVFKAFCVKRPTLGGFAEMLAMHIKEAERLKQQLKPKFSKLHLQCAFITMAQNRRTILTSISSDLDAQAKLSEKRRLSKPQKNLAMLF